MAFGVFMHRSDSRYDDVIFEQYQFPKQYLNSANKCNGDWIVYLEPSSVKNTKGYFAIARIKEIIPDPNADGMFFALIEPGSYLDFGRHVQYKEDGFYLEQGLLNEKGRLSGRAQSAVRVIADADFARIVERGLADEQDIPPRSDQQNTPLHEMAEDITPFGEPAIRPRINILTERVSRDRNFRKTVLKAYDEKCAITGICLINGGGRAEVEAAHTRPVEHNGPDSIGNGLALTGTAHWMFDRGLVGINDNYEILISRQVNDPTAVRTMINEIGHLILPKFKRDYPQLNYIRWHRAHCFKN